MKKDYLKHVNKPTFTSTKIFDKNYVAIHKIKPILTLNKPIYVGFTVLELNKWLMYGSITTLLKNILMLNCYFHTQIVLLMK